MRVCWRRVNAAKNTLAVLYAACEMHGFRLEVTESPEEEVTCYSLNSSNEPLYREEIRNADCITIVGGPHASARMNEVAEYADYVVVGEGEYVLPSLLESIDRGRGEIPPGVATSDGYRPANFSTRLDAYPPFSHYKGYIEISRGCPHFCGFCQTPRLFGPYMRHRSIDRIAEFASKYKDVRFVTPNALAYGSDGRTPRLEKVESLLKSLRGDIYFGTFPSEVRPEFLSDRALEMIRTHCRNNRIHFGAQSGSDRVLKALSRGHRVQDIVNAVDLCVAHGFEPVVDFIVGLPMETVDEQLETLRLIEWVTRYGRVHVHLFQPLPGTPLEHYKSVRLHPALDRALGRLALGGKLTGTWHTQSVNVF